MNGEGNKAIKKLDETLQIIYAATTFDQKISFNGLLEKLNNRIGIVSSIELSRIIRKLVKDGNIACTDVYDDFSYNLYILTFEGQVLVEEFGGYELKSTKNKSKTFKEKVWNFTTPLIAAGVGGLLTYILQEAPKDIVLNPVVVPQIQIKHDTIWISKNDTSLVRLVKLKKYK